MMVSYQLWNQLLGLFLPGILYVIGDGINL